MSNKKYQSISLTLFLLILTVFVLAPTVSASSYASGGVGRRDHAALKRFVKKRAATSGSSTNGTNSNNGPVDGASSDPSSDSVISSLNTTVSNLNSTLNTNSSAGTSSTTTTSTTSLPATTSSANSTTTTTTNSTSTTSTSTSSTTTTSSSTTSTTSSQPVVQQGSQSSASSTANGPSSTKTLTETETSIAPTPTVENAAVGPSENGSLSSTGKTTLITVLIVVAASVGGVAILWTVFRKWKLGRSKKFDQRLQPIDWQPTVDDDFLPNRPSPDGASYRSQSDNQSTAGYGATSNLTRGLDHDFTAGPSHLTPVGGYADLARGPSPQPHMQEALSRGPSLTRPNYDNSVPLHHQNGYGAQSAY